MEIFKDVGEIEEQIRRKKDSLWGYYYSVRICERERDERFEAATDFLYELQDADLGQYLECGYEVRLVQSRDIFDKIVEEGCFHKYLYEGKFCKVVLVENFYEEFINTKEVPVDVNPEEALQEDEFEGDFEEEMNALKLRDEFVLIYLAPDIK